MRHRNHLTVKVFEKAALPYQLTAFDLFSAINQAPVIFQLAPKQAENNK